MTDLTEWLTSIGLTRYVSAFSQNDIDLDVLPELSEDDMRELGVSLGHRKKLMVAIQGLAVERWSRPTMPSLAHSQGIIRSPERRQLTVVFFDMQGFTAISQRHDPEDVREIVDAYQRTCTASIKRYDGYVSRYMGDGILAFFGYPTAHEEDAERAILAGLDAVRSLVPVNERLAREMGEQIVIRVGIATGLVVVGHTIGEGPSEELAVTGSTASLANRIQHKAWPNSVVISDGTRALAGTRFRYEDAGTHELKGIDGPVRIWRVASAHMGRARFDAATGSRLSELVGREEQLEILEKRWAQAILGEGQAVLVSGEPGIGKSRLTRALRERIAGEQHEFLLFQCSPYRKSSALHPVITRLVSSARLTEHDPAEQRLEKLRQLLATSGDDIARDLPHIAALLSIPTDGRYPTIELEPKRQKEEILAALERQLAARARKSPLYIVFEDLQWADPSTIELLHATVERIRDSSVLLVVTFRPEFEVPWTREAHSTVVALPRMGRGHTEELVRRTAGEGELPVDVVSQIVQKSDGIPLFVEEFTKAVLETQGSSRAAPDQFGSPAPSLAIPATLHDSLMARLDRLGSAKDIAQVASVIGRRFGHRLLELVVDLDADTLRSELDRLLGAELILPSHVGTQTAYDFKHALVQEEAYSSLLRRRRRELHGRVAQVLVEHFPERARNQPELLAQHYEGAGDTQRAMEAWLVAGKRSVARSNYVEANDQLQRGLALLLTGPPSSERSRRELEILITRGAALAGTGAFSAPGSRQVYERALELCDELGDVPEVFPVLSGAGSFYVTAGNFAEVQRIAMDCLARAERQDSLIGRVIGHRLMGGSRFLVGETREGCGQLEKVLRLVEGERSLLEQSKVGYALDHKTTALCYLALARTALGEVDEGLAHVRSGLEHCEEIGNPHTVNYALCFLAAVHHIRRDDPEAIEVATRSRDMALEHRFGSWVGISRVIRGEALVRQGNHEEGLAEVQLGVQNHRDICALTYLPFALAVLARSFMTVGRLDHALEALVEAHLQAVKTNERWYMPEIHRLRGVALAGLDRNDAAEHQLRESIRLADEIGGSFWALKATLDLARLLVETRRRGEAREHIMAIRTRVDEHIDAPDFAELRELAAELDGTRGHLRLLR